MRSHLMLARYNPRSAVLLGPVAGSAIATLRYSLRCCATLAAFALCSCGARPLLPALSLHAVWVLRQGAVDARETSSHDFGLQAQLAFRPRGAPRTRGPAASLDPQFPVPLPRQPDCQHALACEWAQLAEESTLTALGVAP